MILIDYIYFQLTNLYSRFNNDGMEKQYGIIMCCGLICWNLTIIIILIDFFLKTNLGPSNKYFLLLYYIPVIFFIVLRYWKFTSYKDVNEKIYRFSKTKRIVADILLIIYIIISLPGAVFLAAKLHFLSQV